MARSKATLLESAVADLGELLRWHADQDVPDVGRKVVSSILRRIEILADQPDIGRVVPEFGLPFLRDLVQAPFRIVYRRDKGKVTIVRVWRGERELEVPAPERDPSSDGAPGETRTPNP